MADAKMRLIRAEDAVSWLRAVSNVMPGEIDHHGMSLWNNLRSTMIESIGYCKTVDAVEVVRCKDCGAYDTRGCADGFGWCMQCDKGMMDNDFCSHGGRRNNEGNTRNH